MPKLTRRRFLQISGAAITVAAGSKGVAKAMELNVGGKAYNYAKIAVPRSTAFTVSPFAKIKSPLEVSVENGTVMTALGHPNHPSSRGRTTAIDAVSHVYATDPDRLTYPMKRTGSRGSNQWKKISWDEALKEIAGKIGASQSDAVWLLRGEDSTSGLWKRFMNTLGSSSVAEMGGDINKKTGQTLTWGEEIEVPDFANSKYILNFGANIYETFQPFAQAVADGRAEKHAKLVTFDPRMSMTAGLSDEWVPVVPGTDGLVALAMANVIMQEKLHDAAFINSYTNVSADALAKHLSKYTLEMAEKESGVKADVIKRLAIEFATTKPATIFTYRGVSSHTNGTDSERACMLLPIITGNIDVEGGYCLPRRFRWEDIKPAPAEPKKTGSLKGSLFPYAVKAGTAKVGVLFVSNTNPTYSASASLLWKEVLKDEKAVPFSVAVTSYMNETSALCDLLLPDAVFVEKTEPVTTPSLFPWVGARTALSKAPGEVRELSVILRDIIRAVDADGGKKMKQFWEFEEPGELLGKYFETIPELKAAGGFDEVKNNGVWPTYGALDIKTGKVLDGDGKPLKAKYALYKAKGFATPSKKIEVSSEALKKRGLEGLPTWTRAENLNGAKELEKEDFIFVTFKSAYRAGSQTANNKYLMEKDHSNHCWINKEVAAEKKIKDGDLVRVTSPVGYLVTRAKATNAIHPKVIAMEGGCGHSVGGRVAEAERHHKPEWASGVDRDVSHNLWWEDNGVNPNDIIPMFIDPVGGASSLSFVAKVEPAKAGDKYGDVKGDVKLHEGFYKKASEQVK